MKDYYKVLGIASHASGKEIKDAFRKLAKRYHPDTRTQYSSAGENIEDTDADQHLQEVYAAYEALSDPVKRAQYDQSGHEAYTQQRSKASHSDESYQKAYYDSMEAFFRDMVDATTRYDELLYWLGENDLPSTYVSGAEVIDGETGDEYSSAKDIRIAKQERVLVWIMRLEDQLNKLDDKLSEERWSIDRISELAKLLYDFDVIDDKKYEQYARQIYQKEIELMRQIRLQAEADQIEQRSEDEYTIMERIESEANSRSARWKSVITQGGEDPFHNEHRRRDRLGKGHKRGIDPDMRKEQRRVARQLKPR